MIYKLAFVGFGTVGQGLAEILLSKSELLSQQYDFQYSVVAITDIHKGSIYVKEGLDLEPPTFEFFLKNDALHDPMINDAHIITFKWATQNDIDQMKALTFKVNDILKALFADAGMLLVDYKLEFGHYQGELMLGDEFSPDGCRLWDAQTRKKLDKDRFRQGLGSVIEAYEEVAQRLGVNLEPL